MDDQPTKIRIIWVTPRFPLGVPDGARHATYALIYHLTQLGVRVDLICLVPAGEQTDAAAARKQLNLSTCTIISRSASKLLRLPSFTTPLTFRAFAAPRVRKALKQQLDFLLNQARSSDGVFVVFDGLHPFAALIEPDLQSLPAQCRGIVYRAHNVETTFWEQCEEKSRTPWFRWFFRHQASLVRSFESHIAQTVDLIAPVSEDDAAKFRILAQDSTVSVTPIGMDFPKEESVLPVHGSSKFELLFVGRLDWLPNRAGLTWFLEKVWPTLIEKRQDMTLKIAGVGDGRWLDRFRSFSGIVFLGKVANIQPLYEASALAIAPLFQGSGTRVKILEAARYGRAVLTTTLGAEGTGLIAGTSYFRAESQEEWVAFLGTTTIEGCGNAGIAAFRSTIQRFDARRIAEQFIQSLSAAAISSL